MRNFHKNLSLRHQSSLSDELKNLGLEITGMSSINMYGLPTLNRLEPLLLPDHLQPNVKKEIVNPQKKIFIVKGSSRGNKRKIEKIEREIIMPIWVEKQVIQVKVSLSNNMDFPISIEMIKLNASGICFEAFPTSVVLPPRTTSFEVILSGKAHQSGTLTILGCFIRSFNIICDHFVNNRGFSIPL